MSFEIAPPTLFYLGQVPVTNTIFTAFLASLVLILMAYSATRQMAVVPGRLQSVAEMVVEQFLAIGAQTADARRARRFLPLAATLFLFILTSNWMGILPLFGEGEFYLAPAGEHGAAATTAGHETPAKPEGAGGGAATRTEATPHPINILRSANSDLNVTFAMGLIVFVLSELAGFRSGGLAYLKEFIWPGLLIEIISHLARPVALALRLFGNILAGEILLAVVTSQLVPIVLPSVFMGFEMFVGIVQALIFALLTLAFMAMATAHDAAQHLAEESGEAVTHH